MFKCPKTYGYKVWSKFTKNFQRRFRKCEKFTHAKRTTWSQVKNLKGSKFNFKQLDINRFDWPIKSRSKVKWSPTTRSVFNAFQFDIQRWKQSPVPFLTIVNYLILTNSRRIRPNPVSALDLHYNLGLVVLSIVLVQLGLASIF